MINRELITKRLLVEKEHLTFNLENFMNGKFASDGAVMLITPKQYVLTDCFVRRENDPTYGEHGDAINAMYEVIYDKPDKIEGSYNMMWQELVMSHGNICLQLCGGNLTTSVFCIPEVITKSQYSMLILFNEKIKEIYYNNKDYFDNNPMMFAYNNEYDFNSVNCIDSILDKYKDKVGEVIYKDEFIVGTNISGLDINYSINNIHGK